VTETLADLYREQGHVDEARDAYERLAEAESRPERAHELLAKARLSPSAAPRPGERLCHKRQYVSGQPKT